MTKLTFLDFCETSVYLCLVTPTVFTGNQADFEGHVKRTFFSFQQVPPSPQKIYKDICKDWGLSDAVLRSFHLLAANKNQSFL